MKRRFYPHTCPKILSRVLRGESLLGHGSIVIWIFLLRAFRNSSTGHFNPRHTGREGVLS